MGRTLNLGNAADRVRGDWLNDIQAIDNSHPRHLLKNPLYDARADVKLPAGLVDAIALRSEHHNLPRPRA
jgi:hypothetical protein